MPGYFDADSMLRRVTGEYIVALSAPRALLLMAAHPVAFEGFFAHTGALSDPHARLRRTGELLDLIAWGDDRAAVDRATARVREIHARIHGRLSVDAGPFPAGTPYRADDPALLLWILASLVDSAVAVYQRWVARLSTEELGALWSDYRTVGGFFGLKPEDTPESWTEFTTYMRQMLASGDLAVTPAARELARQVVLDPPLPIAMLPVKHAMNELTAGLLPDELRRQYGLRRDPVRDLAIAASGPYVRNLAPLLPDRLLRGARARENRREARETLTPPTHGHVNSRRAPAGWRDTQAS